MLPIRRSRGVCALLHHNKQLCTDSTIRSEYFYVVEVSLDVTILCEVEGDASAEDPHLVKEHTFVISDSPVQDQDQELICNYLTTDRGAHGRSPPVEHHT